MSGAIVGKAIYEGRFSVSDALKVVGDNDNENELFLVGCKRGRVVKGIQFVHFAMQVTRWNWHDFMMIKGR